MQLKNINEFSIFIKKVDNSGTNYLVQDTVANGVRTLVTTVDPFKAKQFTLAEALTHTYQQLTEAQRVDVINAHKQGNRSYDSLMYEVSSRFAVVTAVSLDIGYSNDVKETERILKTVGLEYMVNAPEEVSLEV